MKLIQLAILATGIFWIGYFIGAIVESKHSHEHLDEEDEVWAKQPGKLTAGGVLFTGSPENWSTMQEDTLAYAAPDPVVKKRGRPLGSKNKLKETV